MRLFFVNMHRLWGGQSAVVLLLAEELARRGHKLLLAGVAGSELVKRAAAAGLPVHDQLELRRGFRPTSFRRDQQRLKSAWAQFQPEGILTNGSQDTWACALARRRLAFPAFLVRWRHNSFPVSAHPFNRWLYRRLIDHVVVSSQEIAPLLTNRLLPPQRLTVFPPSARLEPFLNASPAPGLREKLGVPSDGCLALCVGRLAPEKGHAVLLRAWRRVVDRRPQAHLALAGHGSQEDALRKLRAELGLDERVHLLGFRDDVPRLYAACDLAVLTPVAGESFGIALLEAYAAGKPCVASDVGGVRDLVLEGRTGLMAPPGEDQPLAEVLLRLVGDPELRRQFGQAGRARVLEHFTPGKLADRAEELFARLARDRETRR
jgi:glycosyltransferase involved in cell wall biosynthesis